MTHDENVCLPSVFHGEPALQTCTYQQRSGASPQTRRDVGDSIVCNESLTMIQKMSGWLFEPPAHLTTMTSDTMRMRREQS